MNYAPDVPTVRHRLLVVCLIRRKARTAGTYCPLDRMYTDCRALGQISYPILPANYDHYKLAITPLQSSYLPTLDHITLSNVDGFYWFIFYVYVRIYFYLSIICYFIFLFILYNIEKESRRV